MNDQQSQLRQLIAKGKVQGYLTYAEVNDHLPSDIADPEQIEDFIGIINDMGIQVYETAPDDDALITDSAAVTTDDEDAEEVAALASVDSEFGRTTDPVRMYMREMGSVELLTRADELKIAKRIEEGHQQLLKAISRSFVVIDDVLQSFDSISEEESGMRLTDMISGFADFSEPDDLFASTVNNDAVEEAAPEEELKGLNYDEVKEKIDALRTQLKVASGAIAKHGYVNDKTEQAFETLANIFMEFKWTPQYLKKLSSILTVWHWCVSKSACSMTSS
jgi:RNA polymerase primary sigma factor